MSKKILKAGSLIELCCEVLGRHRGQYLIVIQDLDESQSRVNFNKHSFIPCFDSMWLRGLGGSAFLFQREYKVIRRA
jgi:hypothetical protein